MIELWDICANYYIGRCRVENVFFTSRCSVGVLGGHVTAWMRYPGLIWEHPIYLFALLEGGMAVFLVYCRSLKPFWRISCNKKSFRKAKDEFVIEARVLGRWSCYSTWIKSAVYCSWISYYLNSVYLWFKVVAGREWCQITRNKDSHFLTISKWENQWFWNFEFDFRLNLATPSFWGN